MSYPWRVLATAETPDGRLSLEQRAERDFLIKINGRILMNSVANRSELALGTLACEGLAGRTGRTGRTGPGVLVGGLGMGFTLRAVLDALPADAEVTVAELNPVIAAWCKGPLAALTDRAVADPRVQVLIADVTDVVRDAGPGRYSAVVIDLYVGPDAHTRRDDALYGQRAVERVAAALVPGGVFAVWGEDYHPVFARTMASAGFTVRHVRPGRGGRRHVVYVGTRAP